MAGYCGDSKVHGPHPAVDFDDVIYECSGVKPLSEQPGPMLQPFGQPEREDPPHPGLVAMVQRVNAMKDDAVNHPKHYTWGPVEVIEITENLGFCLGNVVKYVLRADHKGKPIEDLKKAQWYLEREIARREKEGK